MKKKQLRTKKEFKWGTLNIKDYRLIGRIARKAIARDVELSRSLRKPSTLAERGQLDLVMDLEVCHAHHFKLRLQEMAETKDTFSLLHDIYMIAGSVDKETFGWNGLGVPRFTKSSVK